jgi:hypothetical protein
MFLIIKNTIFPSIYYYPFFFNFSLNCDTGNDLYDFVQTIFFMIDIEILLLKQLNKKSILNLIL